METAVLINSILWVLAGIFLVFAAGASVLWFTLWPIELAIVLCAVLTASEIALALWD